MASRGWGGSVALALSVAAGSAAASLGLGYGLGIIAWSSATDAAGESLWLASLAWTAWIAASATVLGAVVADRFSAGDIGAAPPSRRSTVDRAVPGAVATGAWRLILALTAAVGGLLTVPLVAVPARAAHRPDTYAPQLIAGGYAMVGVAVGLLVAILALSARAVAANVVLTSGWLWALAVASVIHGVATGKGLSTAQLAIWPFGGSHFVRDAFSLPGAALMLGSALLLGIAGTWPAARRGDNKVGMAISGAAGPLLVSAAYFLAAPKMSGVRVDEQLSAYLIAPYAVIAGLAGSVLLTALATQREMRLGTALVPAPVRSTVDDLDDDSYGTPRAYVSDTADKPSGKVPLWPEPDLADAATESKPARGKGSAK